MLFLYFLVHHIIICCHSTVYSSNDRINYDKYRNINNRIISTNEKRITNCLTIKSIGNFGGILYIVVQLFKIIKSTFYNSKTEAVSQNSDAFVLMQIKEEQGELWKLMHRLYKDHNSRLEVLETQNITSENASSVILPYINENSNVIAALEQKVDSLIQGVDMVETSISDKIVQIDKKLNDLNATSLKIIDLRTIINTRDEFLLNKLRLLKEKIIKLPKT